MKSIFDNNWNNFEEVKFDPDSGIFDASAYSRLELILPKNSHPYNGLFEQNPDSKHPSFNFLIKGYDSLKPITNIDVIKKRQSVVKAFNEVFWEKHDSLSKFKSVFNNLHLLNDINNYRTIGGYSTDDLARLTNSLKVYSDQINILTQEMAKYDNILGELSSHYRNRFPKKIVDNIIKACEQGKFDYMVLEVNPRHLETWGGKKYTEPGNIRLHGVMNLPKENIKNQLIIDTESRAGLGFDFKDYTGVAANNVLEWLDKIYSPLAALFVEGYHMSKTSNSCLPEINDKGIFEMVNGRPIMPTKNPIGTSLYFDNDSSKIVLNGIHSGGKSYLLRTIASYYLAGLSGVSVPANAAKIPVINRIFNSFDITKQDFGGSLESELNNRSQFLRYVKKGDLVLMDEFLQHASPDASTDLEPIILGDFYKTGATVVVVTHRGDSLDDKNQWQFYSPGFTKEANGEIVPSYQFEKGKPSQEILRAHAKQMLHNALNKELDYDITKDSVETERANLDDMLERQGIEKHWAIKIKNRLFGRDYLKEYEHSRTLNTIDNTQNTQKTVLERGEDDDLPF